MENEPSPLILIMAMPPLPGAVAIAAIVSSCVKSFLDIIMAKWYGYKMLPLVLLNVQVVGNMY